MPPCQYLCWQKHEMPAHKTAVQAVLRERGVAQASIGGYTC